MELVNDDDLPDPPVPTPPPSLPPSKHWLRLTPEFVEAYCEHCVQADEIRWTLRL